nr:MAG TPA: hypothetical protein [Caudoviricetes sp.]
MGAKKARIFSEHEKALIIPTPTLFINFYSFHI